MHSDLSIYIYVPAFRADSGAVGTASELLTVEDVSCGFHKLWGLPNHSSLFFAKLPVLIGPPGPEATIPIDSSGVVEPNGDLGYIDNSR